MSNIVRTDGYLYCACGDIIVGLHLNDRGQYIAYIGVKGPYRRVRLLPHLKSTWQGGRVVDSYYISEKLKGYLRLSKDRVVMFCRKCDKVELP